MNEDVLYLYDENEDTKTRYVCFHGKNRHDVAITTTDRFFGKKLVINLQNNRAAIIGQDDLKEEGYLEFAFALNEEEAEELKQFLENVI